MDVFFYIAAVVAIISTIMAISGRNAIHSLLYLILSLLAISVIFYLLSAPFIAALEVIIYAGAIMVLFIFVTMMLNIGIERETEKKWLKPANVDYSVNTGSCSACQSDTCCKKCTDNLHLIRRQYCQNRLEFHYFPPICWVLKLLQYF